MFEKREGEKSFSENIKEIKVFINKHWRNRSMESRNSKDN